MENHPYPAREQGAGPREVVDVDDVVARDGRSGGRRRWLWFTVLVALVVGSVAVGYADHRARTREAAAVAGCEHSLRLASALWEGRMGLLVTSVQPARRPTAGGH